MKGGWLTLLGICTALPALGATPCPPPCRLLWSDAPLQLHLALVPGQVSPRMPEIDKANEQVDSGDFEEAIKTLQQGLSQPDLTDDQLAEMYRLLGLAHLYLGNEEKARDAFEKLLQARPDYELPKSAPPKIRALYARIRFTRSSLRSPSARAGSAKAWARARAGRRLAGGRCRRRPRRFSTRR